MIQTIKHLGLRPLVMGIINVTPDSFSGDGMMKHDDYIAAAQDLGARMIQDGADILDIGGESSRPGALPVTAEEELRRVVPVITALAKVADGLPIAVDTVKANVAEAALDAGASIVNDISALLADNSMAKLIAKKGAYAVVMHNRSDINKVRKISNVGSEYVAPPYGDVVENVAADLYAHVQAARKAGIPAKKIIADPGLGFGKTVEQNCKLINHIDHLKERLNCPVLIGPSRKSFLGRALDLPAEERLEATAAAVVSGVLRGADIVRVHDVKFMARLVKMTQAIAES